MTQQTSMDNRASVPAPETIRVKPSRSSRFAVAIAALREEETQERARNEELARLRELAKFD